MMRKTNSNKHHNNMNQEIVSQAEELFGTTVPVAKSVRVIKGNRKKGTEDRTIVRLVPVLDVNTVGQFFTGVFKAAEHKTPGLGAKIVNDAFADLYEDATDNHVKHGQESNAHWEAGFLEGASDTKLNTITTIKKRMSELMARILELSDIMARMMRDTKGKTEAESQEIQDEIAREAGYKDCDALFTQNTAFRDEFADLRNREAAIAAKNEENRARAEAKKAAAPAA